MSQPDSNRKQDENVNNPVKKWKTLKTAKKFLNESPPDTPYMEDFETVFFDCIMSKIFVSRETTKKQTHVYKTCD